MKPSFTPKAFKGVIQHAAGIFFFCLLLLAWSDPALAQVSGTVFRDFNSNGIQGPLTPNLEPGVQGIIVNAFNSSDALVASYTTGSSGTYSIPASGSTYNGTQGSNTGSVASGVAVRIEFVIPSQSSPNCNLDNTYDFTGYDASVYGSNVQFVNGGTTGINYAINNPENYTSTTNPTIYVPVDKNGDPLGGGTTGTSGSIVSFSYTASGTTAPNNLTTQSATGCIWGLAYSKTAKRLFAASFLKRDCGYGPLGSGGIYKIDPSANNQVVQFYDMDGNGFPTRCSSNCVAYGSGTSYTLSGTNNNTITYIGTGLGVIGTNAQRGLPKDLGSPGHDPAAFDQVGKVGLGGIAISDDGKYLFVMNLFDGKLYQLTLNDAANPTSVIAVTSYTIPNPPLRSTWEVSKNGSAVTYTGANNGTGFYDGTKGVQRAFGLKYYKGKLYIGSVTTGENGGSSTTDNGTGAPEFTDLFAYVWEFDGTSISSTPVLQFPLNYPKGITTNFSDCPQRSGWFAWAHNMDLYSGGSSNTKLTWPQPILGDLTFDVSGNMILGLIDRGGDQVGARNYELSNTTLAEYFNGGDMLKAFPNSSCGWRIETSTDRTNSKMNDNEGPDGGEFFWNDNNGIGSAATDHKESVLGGVAVLPGSNQIEADVFDPQSAFNCAGVKSFNDTSGYADNSYQIYASASGNPPTDGTWIKGGGLGDVEMFGDVPCLEVGNRVWNDANSNGIQDAGETGISGVTINLYASDGTTLLGTTTTGTNGTYYFNCSNVTNGLATSTNYIMKVSSSQFNGTGSGVLANKFVTQTNVTGNGHADWSDNDASVVGGLAQISFTTGSVGQNDHTLDFGFRPSCALTASASHTDASCNGSADGTASATALNAVGNVSYLWNTGATSQSLSSLAASTYSVTITDALGCTANASATVGEPSALAPVCSHVDVTTTGGSDGSASVSVTGGTSPYTYLWNDGEITSSISGLIAGTYSVTITDAHSCKSNCSSVVSQPSCTISMSGTQSDVTCNGSANGSIDVTVTGAQGSVSYLWNDGATTQDRSGLSGGTYSVTATDQGGCSTSQSFTINEPAVLGMSGVVSNVTVTNGSDGSIDVTVTGGTSPYTYLWNDGATTEDRTGLTAGTYSVTVTDANNCSASASFTVNQPGCTISMSGTQSDVTCNGAANGSIDVTVTGAQGSVSYLWNDGATTQDRSGLSGGTYSVTATDQGGCSTSQSFTINEPAVLGMSGVVSNVTVTNGSDGSIDVTVTGGTSPYTYLWNDGATTEDRTGLTAGTYSVTVTDANNCSASASFTVNQPGCTISMSGTQNNVTCNGAANGSIDVTVTGAQGSVSYLWNDGATTQDRSGLSGGTYSVTATDQGGCSTSQSFTINEPAVLGMSGVVSNVTVTNGSDGSIDVTVTGGTSPYTYLWNDGATTEDRTGLTAGTYSVTVTDANNCSASASFTVNQPGCTISMSGTQNNVTCNGAANGSIDVTVTGAQGSVSYLWNDGATTQDRSGLSGGTYSVTATDQGGCSTSQSFTINEPAVLGMSGVVSNVTVTNGSDGSIDVTVTGGTSPYTYLWNDGATTEDRTGLTAGTYSVTVTDANNCSASASFTVNQPGCTISMSGTQSDVTCNGSANGSIDVTVTGAQGSVSYLWNDGATTQDRTGLTSGTYSVTATDQSGCSASSSFNITQPAALSLSETHVNVSSSGNDGSITLTVRGGTLPYKYLWSNGKKTKNIKNLTAGTYTVTVTDANGCSSSLSVTITQSNCACVPPTNITFSPLGHNKVQVCWNSVPCAQGYVIKWKLTTKSKWQYRKVNTPDTCTTFTFLQGQTDQIYFATICASGDTSAYGQLYTYPPPSRVDGDVTTAPEFAVFPNPTAGHIMIVLKNEGMADQQATIQIVNVLGQVIQSDKGALVDGTMTKSLELTDEFVSGMYMVNVIIGTKIWHQQIIYAGK